MSYAAHTGVTITIEMLYRSHPFPIQKSNGDLYFVCNWKGNNAGDLYVIKSTDNGATWSEAAFINLPSINEGVSVWYDEWTDPTGSLGYNIHIVANDNTDDVSYWAFDTTTDSLGSEVTIHAFSTSSVAASSIAVTRARGGNICVASDIDGGSEYGFWTSPTGGVGTWTKEADVFEASNFYDTLILMPGFAADTNDIIAIFHDYSASELSRKVYDDSANSWSETSILTSVTGISNYGMGSSMSATIDNTNDKIVFCSWDATDFATARLRAWTIDESNITTLTDVVSSSGDDQAMTAMVIDSNNSNNLWCFYGGKEDGSDTFPTQMSLNYKRSTDGGTTWGTEEAINFHFAAVQTPPHCAMYASIVKYTGLKPVFVCLYNCLEDMGSIITDTDQPRANYQIGI